MPKKQSTKLVEKLLDGLQWLFQIQNFEKEIVINDEDDNLDASMDCEDNYQRLRLSIFPHFFEEKEATQRKIILHELCHTITLPSKKIAHDLLDGKLVTPQQIRETNEEATSKIENILDQLLQGNLTYARKAYQNYLPKKMKQKATKNKITKMTMKNKTKMKECKKKK